MISHRIHRLRKASNASFVITQPLELVLQYLKTGTGPGVVPEWLHVAWHVKSSVYVA